MFAPLTLTHPPVSGSPTTPPRRIEIDVSTRRVKMPGVPDYPVVIIPLPQSAAERGPPAVTHGERIAVRGFGLERLKHLAERPWWWSSQRFVRGNRRQFAAWLEPEEPMEVVRHHDKGIQLDKVKPPREVRPHRCHHFPGGS